MSGVSDKGEYKTVLASWICLTCGYRCEGVNQPPCHGPADHRHDRQWMQIDSRPDEIAALQAECDRLRAALERIGDYTDPANPDDLGNLTRIVAVHNTVRAALAVSGERDHA